MVGRTYWLPDSSANPTINYHPLVDLSNLSVNLKKISYKIERERRFIIPEIPPSANFYASILQGYFIALSRINLRIRLFTNFHKAVISIKLSWKLGEKIEIEFNIPYRIGEIAFFFTLWKINKVRYHLYHKGQCWELDNYLGIHAGIYSAEAETDTPKSLDIPIWVGYEVTGVSEWSNTSIAKYGAPKNRPI